MLTEKIKDILLFIFKEGLDEDAFYRSNNVLPTQQDLIKERIGLPESFEAQLLDLLIEDREWKKE
jgi:hypothetical protein